jgi:hypothetical protein
MSKPLPWWLRAILVLVALQALEMVIAFFRPDFVGLLVPWPASPLNARFIAALYTALGLGVLAASRARAFHEVRIILLGIALATTMLLVLTLPYLPVLDPFPTFWLLFYIVDPLLVAFAFWRLGEHPLRAGTPGTNPARNVWLAQAALFGLGGAVLLVLPELAMTVWPWSMTAELARLYSAFFVTLAVGAALAAGETDWSAVRLPALMIGALGAFVLVASLLHLERFRPGPVTLIWFALFAAEIVVAAGLWLRRRARPAAEGVAS